MFTRVVSIFLLLHSCNVNGNDESSGGQKSWNFEFISLETNSSDESLVKMDIRLDQISRGVYGISGTATFNNEIKGGDSNMIEIQLYRSATGSSDYKTTPYRVAKQHFHSFLNGLYKHVLMNTLSKCSDFPLFEDKFVQPFEAKTYTFNDCRVTNEGMPQYMDEGFYKLLVTATGVVDFTVNAIVKITDEMKK